MLEEGVILSIKNISKTFPLNKKTQHNTAHTKEFWALKNISFDVQKGKVLGIIGSNGAGKTTLLKILSEIIPPSNGTIEYSGTILSILEIGTGFHQDLSGYENIFLNASLLGMKKNETEKHINEIVDFSGISDFIHEPVKSYSSGMYLRLAFSIALFIDFDIILLDEVIAVGDAEYRMKATEKLKEKIKDGKTCIFISHDLPSIINLCDDCVILENGELIFKGTAKEAVESYLTNVQKSIDAKQRLVLEHEKCKFISCTVSKSEYEMDEAIEVRISFEKKCDEDIDIVLKVKNFDSYILSDCDIYRPDYKQKNQPQGAYETTCIIPANLFSAGSYKIDLILGDKNSILLNINSAQKFKVRLKEWEILKKWNEEDESIPFRPICNWETKRISND